MKDYLLAGATGLVGRELVKLLLSRNDTANIFSLGRRAGELTSENLHFIEHDFSSQIKWMGSKKPFKPVAICTLGTTIKIAGSQTAFRRVDYDFVVAFAEIAQSVACESLHVVTAHGAAKNSGIFYNRVKGEIEEKLQQMFLPSLHIYRPSLLIGERKEQRPGEGAATFAAKILSPLFHLPGAKCD